MILFLKLNSLRTRETNKVCGISGRPGPEIFRTENLPKPLLLLYYIDYYLSEVYEWLLLLLLLLHYYTSISSGGGGVGWKSTVILLARKGSSRWKYVYHRLARGY